MSITKEKKRIVKFAPKGTPSFYDTVKQRVDEYFQSTNRAEQANFAMYVKTACMISLYFGPFALILSGAVSSMPIVFIGMWILMGLGIVGIGTSVMHDSNHGSYTDNKFVSGALGGLLNVLGGYAPNWRIQHNVLHHTYTNLNGLDEDIDAGYLMRMCPHKPYHKMYRYQHIYAWPVYAIMNLYWITVKDFKLIFRYHKNGLLRKEKLTLRRAVTELVLLKIFYIAHILVLPILVSGASWQMVVLGFVAMHLLAGLALACVFQPAHVMETSEFARPDEDNRMENSWAVHQVLNTTNFAPRNKIITWFIGGLNYQIEHHLFPHVCHIHYPKISRIVESVAREFNIPYQVQPTFRRALIEHGRMLQKLGQQPEGA